MTAAASPSGAAAWQAPRYRPGQGDGHYESWFLRANHPTRPQAFWIRYTLFAPRGRPDLAEGELWAIHFDGDSRQIRAGKSEIPLAQCAFGGSGLDLRIGEAILRPGLLQGEIRQPHRLCWDLRYSGGGSPLLFLPEPLYGRSFPKAKAVTPRPLVRFSGTLEVDGESLQIDDWVGSENHNWGSKHTDSYAWGQVAGFDNAPEAFLELISARLKVGPLWLPTLTVAVLRIGNEEHRLNGILRGFRAHGQWRYFRWEFASSQGGVRLHGHIEASREDFVGLTYRNPPGGTHLCLNSKIASCELLLEREGQPSLKLETRHRAAFEILTDDPDSGVRIVV
ncbi:MAG TPA: hypothetical protein VLI06_03005 [Solimonas sp.]|nr:hypothetical protein [Solimonas sp.]